MKKNLLTYLIAGLLLLTMGLLAFFSTRGDTFTFDETAHIAAGYSYLTQMDYRMNPEHPPLIKDLAAIPLLFLRLNFPKDNPTWTQATPAIWWHQFDFAAQFLYNSGNDPDRILLWTRIPMIIVLILFGLFIFLWAKKLWGKRAGLIALFLFAFFPTFLAHGRLVTTDIGAAFAAVFATYFWLEFLKNTTKKSLIFAGLTLGLALLIKFSLILLLPFFAIITLIFAWLKNDGIGKFKNLVKYTGLAILAGTIGVVFIIWPAYGYHVAKYPQERQIKDTQDLLNTTNAPEPVIKINILLSSNPITRPLGQYFLGLLTATNRVTTGNTTYFMGKISADSWKSYFPIVYFIKNPLPFHILSVIALIFALWSIKRPFYRNIFLRIKEWIKGHFTEFSMLAFLAIYWATSLISNLNIGVRHLMPVFPFMILLVSAMTAKLLKEPFLKLNPVRNLQFLNGAKYAVLGILFLWQGISVVALYPHFLAYFNESIGGPDKGYLHVIDSNLDWGQDLKRLGQWMDKNGVDKIYLDYFGGGSPNYYLGEKYLAWSGTKKPEELPRGSYLAISANQLQGGRADNVEGFERTSDYYRWLDKYAPIAKIGYSIFVYKIN
ncbi:MAG: glycosyltransferase family 39 protein [Patescibacteria group bacterium]